jgi:hypothetical protein
MRGLSTQTVIQLNLSLEKPASWFDSHVALSVI